MSNNSILDSLNTEDIESIISAANLKNKLDHGEVKYKTVPDVEYKYTNYEGYRSENNEIDKVDSTKVVRYRDTSYADAVTGRKDIVPEYSDWVQTLPKEKQPTYQYIKTPSGAKIFQGEKAKVRKVDNQGTTIEYSIYRGLGDADNKYKKIEYGIKQSALTKFATYVTAADFYADMYQYPSNFTDDDKGVLLYCDKVKKPSLNEFTQFDIGFNTHSSDLISYTHDFFIPKSGYKDCSIDRIKNIFALVVDVDSVMSASLYEFFRHDWGFYRKGSKDVDHYPKPTYIVNSGTGLHLYYVLDTPVPYFSSNYNNSNILSLLNKTMQCRYNTCHNNGTWYYKYGLCGKPQGQYGLAQAFRMAGGSSKFGKPVTVYKYGTKYSIDDLLQAFGLNDAVGCVTLRHDDHSVPVYHNKEVLDKKIEKRVSMIKTLRYKIIKSSTNLYDDLILYANFCAGTRFYVENEYTLDKILSDISDIVNEYTLDKTGFDMDQLTSIVSTNYSNMNKANFIDNSLFSFNNDKTNKNNKTTSRKLPANFYVGVLKQVKNNLTVGWRRRSIYGLGLLAFACGIPEKKYKEDMSDVYDIIQTNIKNLNEKEFPKYDLDTAVRSWRYAKDKKIIPSTKMLEQYLGPCWPDRPSREVYVRNYKHTINNEHYNAYCILLGVEIYTYIYNILVQILDSIENNQTPANSDKYTVYKHHVIVKYPTISDLLKFDYVYPDKAEDTDTKEEFIVNVGANRKPARYFYSKYYNKDSLDIFNVLYSHFYEATKLDFDKYNIDFSIDTMYFFSPKDRVDRALKIIDNKIVEDNLSVDNIKLTSRVMDLTGLSKKTVIKYLKNIDKGLYKNIPFK